MFLHNFIPEPIALTLGPIHIFWYGIIVVLGIIAGISLAAKIGNKYGISHDSIYDLSFYLIIFGLLGARVYDVLLELPYYLDKPLDAFKIWRGGLAIHGAIFAGLITAVYYVRKHKLNPYVLISSLVPGLAIGQAIGRWGNFFNQELFGKPTDLPWSIYISFANRPAEFANKEYYHPTFLYESIGSMILALVLVFLHKKLKSEQKHIIIISTYLIGYSLLRFALEFVRIDFAPTLGGVRWPQIASLAIIIATAIFDWKVLKKEKTEEIKEIEENDNKDNQNNPEPTNTRAE